MTARRHIDQDPYTLPPLFRHSSEPEPSERITAPTEPRPVPRAEEKRQKAANWEQRQSGTQDTDEGLSSEQMDKVA